jgi:ferrochelatase
VGVPEPTAADAVLLVGFGGPAGPEEVMPFLRRVTAGRGVPESRLAVVAARYQSFGGVSPIRAQLDALAARLRERGGLPVYSANRNSAPELTDVIATMAADGVRRAVVVLMTAYSAPSACRAYRDAVHRAASLVPGAPLLELARLVHADEGFRAPFVDGLRAALERHPRAAVLFTAHSVPLAQAEVSRYVGQVRAVAEHVAAAVGRADPVVVWQSRSGPPQVPWLEPDIAEQLEVLAADGVDEVVVVPVGFTSDHMEVAYDLDVELAAAAARLGVTMVRVATPGTDDRYVAALVRSVEERRADPAVVGDACPDGAGCCLAPPASR